MYSAQPHTYFTSLFGTETVFACLHGAGALLAELCWLGPPLQQRGLLCCHQSRIHWPRVCCVSSQTFFFFFLINLFIYFWLCWVFVAACGLSPVVAGATLRCSWQASHCGGFFCCRARALQCRLSRCGARGLVASQHVGSSRTRDRTRVPCIGRQILNHRTTREVHSQTSLCQLFVFMVLI